MRQESLRRPRGALVAALLLAVSVLAIATPARAAVTCTVPLANVLLVTVGDGDTATFTYDPGTLSVKVNGGSGTDCTQPAAGWTFTIAGTSGSNTVVIDATNSTGTVAFSISSMDLGSGTDELRFIGGAELVARDWEVTASLVSVYGHLFPGLSSVERLSFTLGNGGNSVDASASPIGIVVTGGTGQDGVVGSAFNDTISLGAGNDGTFAGAGNDTINGGDGDDIIYGEAGADIINGDAGNDMLGGSTGNDVINGGAGADAMSGEADTDTISFAGGAAMTLDMNVTTPQNTGNGTDALADFENVIGSASNDTLVGSSTTYSFDGGGGTDTVSYAAVTTGMTVNLPAGTVSGSTPGPDVLTAVENVTTGSGNDTIIGDGANNTLNAGAGVDTISYASSIAAVTIDLAAGSASGAGTDTLVGFENATGGSGNDTLTGNAGANVLDGGSGNDKFKGGGGDDTIKGGLGIDSVVYKGTANAVSVDLTAGQGGGGAAGTDTLEGIENVTGTSSADTIRGDGLANVLKGGGGGDTMYGLNGADTLGGGPGDDDLYGGNGDDTINGGPGADVCQGGKGTNAITKC